MTRRTENNNAEPPKEALEQHESRFEAMAGASPDAIINISSEGVILFWNSAAEKMFGYGQREIIGQNVTNLMPERYRFKHRHGLKKFFTKGTGPLINHTAVLSALSKDHKEFPIELTLSVWSQKGGTFVTGTIRDLSGVKVALKETEDRFLSMINSSLDGILAYNKNFIITIWNPEMEKISGLKSKDVLGRNDFELFPFLEKVNEGRAVKRALKGQATRQVEMYFEVPESGRKGYFESTHFPVYDVHGNVAGGMGIVREVTERKKTEEALRQKDHEVRKAYTDVFSAVTNEKLVILTKEEIAAAQGETCGDSYTVSSFEQLADLRVFLRDRLRACGLSKDYSSKMISASGEAVVNGVKHAGSCEVQVSFFDGTVQIRVTDHGPGIDFSELPKATLLSGFSIGTSLGMGFTIILDASDRVLLSTNPEGTTLLLEIGGKDEQGTLGAVLSRSILNKDTA